MYGEQADPADPAEPTGARSSTRHNRHMAQQAKSARGADRRERILRAAAELMAEHGYPVVSMSQIGAAAGIVGSGVYRHFGSKATILDELLERVVDAMSSATEQTIAELPSGPARIEAMIRRQTAIAVENRPHVAVYLRDAGNLPAAELRALRRRQRALVEAWVAQFALVASGADQAELRAVVHAVFAVTNSASSYDSTLPPERLIRTLGAIATAAAFAGLHGDRDRDRD